MKKIILLFIIGLDIGSCNAQDSVVNKISLSWGTSWCIPTQKDFYSYSPGGHSEFYPYPEFEYGLLTAYNLGTNPLFFEFTFGHTHAHKRNSFFDWSLSLSHYRCQFRTKYYGYYSYRDASIGENEIFHGKIISVITDNYFEFSFIEQYNIKIGRDFFWMHGIGTGIDLRYLEKTKENRKGYYSSGPYYPSPFIVESGSNVKPYSIRIYYKTGLTFNKKGYSISPFIILPLGRFYTIDKSIFPIGFDFLAGNHIDILSGINVAIFLKDKKL